MARTATVVKLNDAEIDQQLAALNTKDREKLNKFTRQEIGRLGVVGVREGSGTWQKAQRAVLEHLAGAGLTVAEVDEGEE